MLTELAGDTALQVMLLHWPWQNAGLKAIRNAALPARCPRPLPPRHHLFPGLLPCFLAFLSLPCLLLPPVPPWKLSQLPLRLPPVAASPSRSSVPLLTRCDLLGFQVLPLAALFSRYVHVQTLKTGVVTGPARLCRPVTFTVADPPRAATASSLGSAGVTGTVMSMQRAGVLAGGSSMTGPQRGFCERRRREGRGVYWRLPQGGEL